MSKISIKYVGKESELVGKTLWEIVGNLKDFGVGRIIVRNSYASRYNEPCFMRILEVKAEPKEVPPKIQRFRWPNDFRDKDRPRKVQVLCENIFRGVKFDKPHLITGASSLPDFRLIPKHLEHNFVHTHTYKEKIEQNVLPKDLELPPLLCDMLNRSGVKDAKMKTIEPKRDDSLYRVAKEGEQPTREFEKGFGTAKSPNLYKNVNYDV